MPRFDATTVLLRPVPAPTTDLWDDLLRMARRVEHDTTQTLVRKWAYWVVPAALTALVTAVGLARPGLWTDELATWGMATTSWAEFWPVIRYVDAVIAPYYAFMHVWVSVFGDSDVALRMPSLLAMVFAAALIGVIGNRLAGRAAGLLAGAVFAVLPSTSRFAAEARPYALTVLAACFATWLLLRAWERPSIGRWAAYGAALAALGWLSMVAMLLIAAHAWVILAWQRTLWWRFFAAAAAATVALLPLLYFGAQQRNQVAYIPRVTFDSFVRYNDVLFGSVLVGVLVVAVGMFSLPLRFPSALFLAWAVVPAGTLIAVSQAMPMFLPRYLLFTTPGWALLAGTALARLRPTWSVVAVLLVAVVAIPIHLEMRKPGGHEQATRQAAAVITANTQRGDALVYADDEAIGAWTTRDAMNHYLPADARPRDVLAIQPPRTDGLLTAKECPDTAACLKGVPRLWIVRTGHLADPLGGIGATKQTAIAKGYQLRQLWYPTGLTVALLEPAPARR